MDHNLKHTKNSKRSLAVAPSPLNELKLDALLWTCGGIILLLLLENLKTSNGLQLGVLFGYGLIAVLSIVYRTRKIVAKLEKSTSDTPE